MSHMNAWLWNNNKITLATKAVPTIGDYSVLVKNTAIGINPVDWKLIEGNLGSLSQDYIPGVDGTGTIIAVGDKVQHLELGARVTYHTDLRRDGSFSEYTAVDARALLPVPSCVNNVAAAAFPCPGLTALQAVQKLPEIIGQRILVNGAGGAVGNFICQLLTQQGAKVYAVASAKRHEVLKQIGVIQCIDYHNKNWLNELSTTRFFAAFDMVNGESAAKLAPLLEYYGHLISVQDRVDSSPVAPFTTSISIHEIALAALHAYGTNAQWHKLIQGGIALLKQIEIGQLTLPSIKTVPFNKIDSALEKLKTNNDGTKYIALMD